MFSSLALRGALVLLSGVTIPAAGYVYMNYDSNQQESTQIDLSSITNVQTIDKKYTIYATNETTDTNFKNSDWNDDKKHWVQIDGDNKWSECQIKVIKIDNNKIASNSNDTVSTTLGTAKSIFEIQISEDIGINWQTKDLNIKQKSVKSPDTISNAKLKFLVAKNGDSWIGKTNTFIGSSTETKTYNNTNKFSYCLLNGSSCEKPEINSVDVKVENDNGMSIEVISKSTTTITKIEEGKSYLIKFADKDSVNFMADNEIVIHSDNNSKTSHFENLKPVISVADDKFFELIGFQTNASKAASSEVIVYATNTSAISDFVASTDTNDLKYSCSLPGSLWTDCSAKSFDNNAFNKELPDDLKTQNNVFEIKLDKDVGLNWQTSEIKIKQKSVASGSVQKEVNLKMLFSQSGQGIFGKTKYFVGKSTFSKTGITGEGSCTINKIKYGACKIYDMTDDANANRTYESKKPDVFPNPAPKSTEIKEGHFYLIEIKDMNSENVKEVNFQLTLSTAQSSSPASSGAAEKPQTLNEMVPVFYDETSKFVHTLKISQPTANNS